MRDAACDTGVIIADAVALAELPGGTGHERVRIDWLNERLAASPGSRHVDGVGNLVWTFGPPPYRLAVLVHVDDVFGEQTARGVTRRDGWLCGPGIGDNVIAVATAAAVIERALAGPGERPPSAVHELIRLLTGMIAPVPAPLSVNAGLADGGTGVSAIAARASATVEWRATDQAALDRQEAALAELTAEVSPGLRLEAEHLDRRQAGSVPLAHPLVAAVLRARRAVGLPDATGDGSTDANAAFAAGIPAVALGCRVGEDMHAPTERIRADSTAAGASQLQAVLAEILD